MTTTAAAVEWRSSLEEALVDARADTPVLLDFFSPT